MTALSDCVLVMLECVPYGGLMQRHQHLARELSKYLKVIYVEETPSWLRRVFDGKPLDPALGEHKLGLQEISANLTLFKAPPYVPRSFGFKRSIGKSALQTARRLKPLLPEGHPVILWVFSPAGLGSIGCYGEVLSVFDYYDAFGEFPNEKRFRKEILEAIEKLARAVDLTIATNEELAGQVRGLCKKVAIVKNGCDPDHFATGGTPPASGSRIVDMEALRRPVIGYMGDIAPWVEIEYLQRAASRHPEWSFVMLGTWKMNQPPPREPSNLIMPGRVSYDELPYYARQFDVGTIPFKLTDLTKVVDPLKLYEYFALGIPVVATALPEVACHGGLVYTAGSADEFVALLDVAVREPKDSGSRAARIEVARRNSWKERGAAIAELLNGMLNAKAGGQTVT